MGRARARRIALWGAGVLVALLALPYILEIVGVWSPTPVASHVSGAPTDTCATKGISVSGGREGICTRYDNPFPGPATYNVVDSGHVLKMPGFDARLLASVITPTSIIGVPPTAANATDYPNGHGLLVSFELSITNERPTPLEFDQGGREAGLLIGTASRPYGFTRPQATYPGANAPPPQLDEQGAIPAHGTSTGWVSFIAPVWAPKRLNAPGTDLELFPQGMHSYVGQIGRCSAPRRPQRPCCLTAELIEMRKRGGTLVGL
jgi:hypothetical protein